MYFSPCLSADVDRVSVNGSESWYVVYSTWYMVQGMVTEMVTGIIPCTMPVTIPPSSVNTLWLLSYSGARQKAAEDSYSP